ncbi:hypothetical protein CHU00_06575 [Sphingobacterium cellulitidis]|uniref:hypothetical protein n=1 Tax=Sphingobacterium cellulitidis TaxID=1768011 RepID=UPI000B9400F1|nr:hypothetical protein [Sphingobacterium cellulitidis]OYD46351.1 hypothetical protein CHU00_06575 [Sphingobacterium cellulitidis]
MKLSIHIDNFLKRAAGDNRLLPSHISLFMAIFYYSPDGSTDSFFRVSRRQLMRYSRIRSIATYHKCVRELVEYGYIEYVPSYDPFRASKMAIVGNS